VESREPGRNHAQHVTTSESVRFCVFPTTETIGRSTALIENRSRSDSKNWLTILVGLIANLFASSVMAHTIRPIDCLSATERTQLIDELKASLQSYGGLDGSPMASQMREIAARIPVERKALSECRAGIFGGFCSAEEFRLNGSIEDLNRINEILKLRNSIVIMVRNKYRAC
jgi:hypothetical protein